MKPISLEKEISSVTYPGRGIVIGRSADGTKGCNCLLYYGQKRKQQKQNFC